MRYSTCVVLRVVVAGYKTVIVLDSEAKAAPDSAKPQLVFCLKKRWK